MISVGRGVRGSVGRRVRGVGRKVKTSDSVGVSVGVPGVGLLEGRPGVTVGEMVCNVPAEMLLNLRHVT